MHLLSINIQRVHLYKDGLHVEHGKCGLARNFIYNLNFLVIFRYIPLLSKHTHTHHNTLSTLDTDLQVLLDLRSQSTFCKL